MDLARLVLGFSYGLPEKHEDNDVPTFGLRFRV